MINTIWLIPDTPHIFLFLPQAPQNQHISIDRESNDKTSVAPILEEKSVRLLFSLICVSLPHGTVRRLLSATWMISSFSTGSSVWNIPQSHPGKFFLDLFPTVISVIFMIPALEFQDHVMNPAPPWTDSDTPIFLYPNFA